MSFIVVGCGVSAFNVFPKQILMLTSSICTSSSCRRKLSRARWPTIINSFHGRDFHVMTPRRQHITSDRVRFLVDCVMENTVESVDHLTPEIKLRLITPACSVWHSRENDLPGNLSDPFWGFYWPGGQALTRYLLDHAYIVKDKTIFDFGSGCGAAAIASALGGAKKVVANDICDMAAAAIAINAEMNKVNVDICTQDMIGVIQPEWDIVLVGDMFYDNAFAGVIAKWLSSIRSQGKSAFIGDPGRLYFMMHPIKKKLQLLRTYELPESAREQNHGLSAGFVWSYM